MKLRLEVNQLSSRGSRQLNQTFFNGNVKLPNYLNNVRTFNDGGTAVSNYSDIFNNSTSYAEFINEVKYMVSDRLKRATVNRINDNYELYGDSLRMNSYANDIVITITALDYPIYDSNGNLTNSTIQKVLTETYLNGEFYEPSEFFLKGLTTVFNTYVKSDSGVNMYVNNFEITSFNVFS